MPRERPTDRSDVRFMRRTKSESRRIPRSGPATKPERIGHHAMRSKIGPVKADAKREKLRETRLRDEGQHVVTQCWLKRVAWVLSALILIYIPTRKGSRALKAD